MQQQLCCPHQPLQQPLAARQSTLGGGGTGSVGSRRQRRHLATVAAAAGGGGGSSEGSSSGGGLPFCLSRPPKVLRFKWARRTPGYTMGDLQVEVDALSEGAPAGLAAREVASLLEQLEGDAQQAVPLTLAAKQAAQPSYRLPAIANLSLVLCDDATIRRLNRESRGIDAPTDVLSFEMPDESPALQLPVKLLGDLVVSLDTAARQAEERG
jgi:hypothetical protein